MEYSGLCILTASSGSNFSTIVRFLIPYALCTPAKQTATQSLTQPVMQSPRRKCKKLPPLSRWISYINFTYRAGGY